MLEHLRGIQLIEMKVSYDLSQILTFFEKCSFVSLKLCKCDSSTSIFKVEFASMSELFETRPVELVYSCFLRKVIQHRHIDVQFEK